MPDRKVTGTKEIQYWSGASWIGLHAHMYMCMYVHV